mgnify:CR=1 FL=1
MKIKMNFVKRVFHNFVGLNKNFTVLGIMSNLLERRKEENNEKENYNYL